MLDFLFNLLHLLSEVLVFFLEVLGVGVEAQLFDAGPSLEESVVCGLKIESERVNIWFTYSKILGVRAGVAKIPSEEFFF